MIRWLLDIINPPGRFEKERRGLVRNIDRCQDEIEDNYRLLQRMDADSPDHYSMDEHCWDLRMANAHRRARLETVMAKLAKGKK